MPETDHLKIEVRSVIKGGYKLKVSDLRLGIYVDGFRATRSTQNASGWWIQSHSFRLETGRYKTCPEYDTHSEYWRAIEEACISTVELYEKSNIENESDFDRPVTMDDLDAAVESLGLENEKVGRAVRWKDADDHETS